MIRIALGSSLNKLAQSSRFRRVLLLVTRFAARHFLDGLRRLSYFRTGIICSVHAVAVNGV